MTEDQFNSLVQLLVNLQFLAEVVALAVCFSAGTQSLKFFLYVKNHRDIW